MRNISSWMITVLGLAGGVPAVLGATGPLAAGVATQSAPTSQVSAGATRTREEVEALINQAGKTKPDWYDSVELKYPETLDLTWSNQNMPGWEPDKKLGSYLFGVIGSNPGRYREGVRLLHQVVIVNQKDKKKLAQSMEALGTAYHDLLGDYPRAVFWWRQADKIAPGRYRHTVDYARCYYKMGCREMAVDLIGRVGHDNTSNGKIARLWAELGDSEKALAMAQAIAEDGRPDLGYLVAGDICRQTGEFAQAIAYYQKVLATTETTSRALKYFQERAMRNLEGVTLLDALDLSHVQDGTYRGSAIGYVANVDMEVVVKKGRITSVKVIYSEENRPLSTLTEIPERILAKQGIKGVDVVAGATITSDAIINATGKALQQGMK